MSYQRPPAKSPYGDTDFTYEDNWSTTGVSPTQSFEAPTQGFDPPTQGFDPPTQGFGQQAPANQAWSPSIHGSQARNIQQPANQPINTTPALTQEDILFLRTCKEDCFYKRTGPLSYFKELQRRFLEQAPDTPYIRLVRQVIIRGKNPLGIDDWGQQETSLPPVAPAYGSELSNPNLAADFQPFSMHEPRNPDNEQQARPHVSYGELRDRNRGYIR